VAEEVAAALAATDKDVSIGGAGLAAAAIELGLVDELRTFRYPVVVGGGTPFLPPVTQDVALDVIETRTFRLARDLRALPARPRRLGLTPSDGALTRSAGRVPQRILQRDVQPRRRGVRRSPMPKRSVRRMGSCVRAGGTLAASAMCAQVADAAPLVDASCPRRGAISFSPGRGLVPKPTEATVSGTLSSCVSGAVAGAT
jgi:hypothetical protein